MTTERAKDFKGTLRQLLAAMSKYKLSLVVVIVLLFCQPFSTLQGPKILAKATTALATGWIAKLRGVGGIDFAYIGKCCCSCWHVPAVRSVQLHSGLAHVRPVAEGLLRLPRPDQQKINRLPLAYFEKRTVGEVLSRITNDVDTLGQSLNQSVTQLITSVATMVGVLIMMLSISPKMTLIALLILPVSLALVLVVVKFSQKYFKAQQATLGVVNGQVEGGLLRPQRHQGVQPRGPPCWTTSTPRTISCTNPRGNRSFVRPDAAHHELCGQPGLCGRCHRRQHFCRSGRHHHRRYSGVHPVRQELLPSPSSSWRRCPTCCKA